MTLNRANQRRYSPTADERAAIKSIRERAQRDKPGLSELVASGEYTDPMPLGDYIELVQTVAALRRAREEAGLSLADIAERTGMDRGAVSKLETGVHGNPTMATLQRYAAALGKQLVVKLVDLAPPTAASRGA
ncbi:MAG TPA: helix-turn-helix domain-containing protein [Pirellulales bacterium]|nr:helix-turn-helix domain-containing protein [Pirellulales bacterium]